MAASDTKADADGARGIFTIVFYSDFDDFDAWKAALESSNDASPGSADGTSTSVSDCPIRLVRASEVDDPSAVHAALVWKPPHDFFTAYPALQLIVNLGAGVDALVARDDLPDVPITRLSDPHMARMMGGFVLFAVLRHARDIHFFEQAQKAGEWRYKHPRHASDIRVAVLGLGELGGHAASELARQDFDVRGWSRTERNIDGVRCFHGLGTLAAVLAEADILVVMLPSTPETRGLLDAKRLALLPAGACFVNVSRGDVVDEDALVAALRSGAIAEATLDVFAREPLAPGHPLWSMPQVLVTPHLASVALPKTAARQIVDNVRRLRAGGSVANPIDRGRNY